MRSTAGLLVGLGMWALLLAQAARAEERIEGIVRDAVVTHCDATRRGGCAGTLTLERRAGGRAETLTIEVPLGTPISREGERVLLHKLEGKTVIVTQIAGRGARVARAIQLLSPPAPNPQQGRLRTTCADLTDNV
jgi:hypothetical protein